MNSSLARFPVGAFSLGFFMRFTNVRKLWCLAPRLQSTAPHIHVDGWVTMPKEGQ